MAENNQAKAVHTAQEMIESNINQSAALAVQDAVDLLRQISTIEATVIGVASAKWLAQPEMNVYEAIISNAKSNITFAVENLEKVGVASAKVIQELQPK